MRSLFGGLRGRWRLGILPLLVALLAAWLVAMPVTRALAQQAPPGTAPKYLTAFQAASAPAQFDLLQIGYDFPPYAWAFDHTHGGQTFNTVMSGEVILKENGTEKIYKAGETWSDPVGQVHSVGNNSQVDAIVYTSVILPRGAELTTTHLGDGSQVVPPGPNTLFLTRFPVSSAPSPLDLVQAELDQPPGGWSAVHTHPGAAYNTVVTGQLMVRADGKDTTYGPGQSWVNPQGQVHAVQNVSSVQSAGFVTFLVPRGTTQVSKQVAPPPTSAPPASGAAASAPTTSAAPNVLPTTGSASSPLANTWPALLALALIVAGLALRMMQSRRGTL